MKKWKTLAEIRREYGQLELTEESAASTPFEQFELWFKSVLETEKTDPTAMVLSTVDEQGHPDSRIVLLKGIIHDAFIFYTNYQSTKALQMTKTPYVALNFYWPETARQVRIRGRIKKTTASQSDEYFLSRPLASQFSAICSPQSQVVESRVALEQRFKALIAMHQKAPVVRPEYWGGYAVMPEEVEFWQGRDNRLHDRIQYYLDQKTWKLRRLAP